MFTKDIPDLLKPDILYQSKPRPHNSRPDYPHRRDWTDSLETYQNAARKEYHVLLANYRESKHLITLKYDRVFTSWEIRSRWSKLKPLLRRQGIISFVVIEITTHRCLTPDGGFGYYPINKVHYHFLVANDLSERRLRGIFNETCLEAGFDRKDFTVQYVRIRDREHFEDRAEYILKYRRYAHMAVLFRRHTGIYKIDTVCPPRCHWFIHADGTRMNKAKEYKAIVAGWYSHRHIPEPPDDYCYGNEPQESAQRQGVSVRLRLWGTLQVGGEAIQYDRGVALTFGRHRDGSEPRYDPRF